MTALASFRRRLPRRGDDRGSMALAILVIIVGVGLCAVLLPMTLSQMHSTGFTDSRAREVNAAEAGIDVALGMIRSSNNATGAGVVASLPCTTDRPLTGTVAGSSSGLSYSVAIGYYTENPLGQSTTWLAPYTASNGGHGMICASGSGTYYPPTKEQVPSYVLITSRGIDARGGRTLQSTYFVKTTNANVAGGTVYVFPAGSQNYCMDAGSANPAAGVAITLQTCILPVAQQQAWAYNADLSIQLVSSVTSAYPNGLCLSSPPAGTQQKVGDAITLQPCAAVPNAPWYQQWSVDNVAHLEGSKPDKSNINGLCINAASQGAGVALTLQTCAGGVTDTKQTWVPSPDAGAGMAGASNSQLVDFQQFGRCMDVTNTDVTSAFLIAYTCKQNPNPGLVSWNQKFSLNAAGEFVTNNGSPYCLRSPLTTYAGPPNGPYVTVTACPNTPTSAVTWKQYGATDGNGNPLPALQKYTVQDSSGNCLSLTTGTTDLYNSQYSKVIVAACDGSTVQKWNATPDVQQPALKNIQEIGNSGS
jgi:hypothetical protein